MQAVILAGGFGTRLRSVVADTPKPMALIHGKPFLAYILDYLISQGITDVVLSVHYLKEQIETYFKTKYNGISIRYAVEEQPLGTGGAIKHALNYIDTSSPVFVLNGDTFLKLDYQILFSEHQKNASSMTIVLRKMADCSRYGVVFTEKNTVTTFKEQGDPSSGLINAGVYLIQPDLFNPFPISEKFSFEKDFLFSHVATIKPRAFVVDDYFIDIGVPEDYARASAELGMHMPSII
jgi:D-glycero-alpha-D-manno-heptose 1-phosphate guanylyltransferase